MGILSSACWQSGPGRVPSQREGPDEVVIFNSHMKVIVAIAVRLQNEVIPLHSVSQQIPAAEHLGASPWSSLSPSIPSYGAGELFRTGTWSLSWTERRDPLPLIHQPLLPHLPLLNWSPPPQTGEIAAPQIAASAVWGTARGPHCSS